MEEGLAGPGGGAVYATERAATADSLGLELSTLTLCHVLLIRRTAQRWLSREAYPPEPDPVPPAQDPDAPLCQGTPCAGSHPHSGARAAPGSEVPLCLPCQSRPRMDHLRVAFRLALDRASLPGGQSTLGGEAPPAPRLATGPPYPTHKDISADLLRTGRLQAAVGPANLNQAICTVLCTERFPHARSPRWPPRAPGPWRRRRAWRPASDLRARQGA